MMGFLYISRQYNCVLEYLRCTIEIWIHVKYCRFFSPSQQISSQISSYVSFLPGYLCCCHTAPPSFLSLFCSQCVSVCCFRIFSRFEFWFLPSVYTLLLCFQKLFPPFLSLPVCVSLTRSLLLPWCFFLFVSWFISHNLALVLISLYFSFSHFPSLCLTHTHTQTASLVLGCLWMGIGMSLSKLQSYRAP